MSRSSVGGTPTRGRGGAASGASAGHGRERVSPSAGPAITAMACSATGSSRAKIVVQSSVRQAGTVPRVGTSPRVGLIATMPWNAAGTRPDPAVSVPTPRSAMPSATATAEPELDPPDTWSGRRTSRTAP